MTNTTTTETQTFTNSQGNPSRSITLTNGETKSVAIIYPNARYGRSAVNTSGRVLIEFRLDWLCAQYHLATIVARDERGLVLDCGFAADSTVSAAEMASIREWILGMV